MHLPTLEDDLHYILNILNLDTGRAISHILGTVSSTVYRVSFLKRNETKHQDAFRPPMWCIHSKYQFWAFFLLFFLIFF